MADRCFERGEGAGGYQKKWLVTLGDKEGGGYQKSQNIGDVIYGLPLTMTKTRLHKILHCAT